MPNTFKAATWNVNYASASKDLVPSLNHLRHDGVSIILFQEMSNPDNRAIIQPAGYEFFFVPRQYIVAWDPTVWVPVHSEMVRLSPTSYYSKGGDGTQFTDAASVILSDMEGRTLEALSYHTPAGVQVANPPARRTQAAKESFVTLNRRAKASKTRAILYGGDDNVDERFGNFLWTLVGNQLTQVVAPSATHGAKRRIDDFRIKNLRVGEGVVYKVPGADDHNIHERTFTWK